MGTGTGAKARRSRFGQGGVDPAQNSDGLIVYPFDKQITITDPGAAVAFGSVSVVGLPIGDLLILGGILNLDIIEALAGISNTFTPTTALGTAATADATLSGNEINILGALATSAAVASVARVKRAIPALALDANTPAAVFLNMTLPDADVSAGGAIRVRGVLRLAYVGLGKNV